MGKTPVNIIGIGSANSGMLTVVGHLIYKMGGIDKSALDAKELEGSADYAWVMDKLKTGAAWQFETKQRSVNIVNASGHENFFRTMMTGTYQADCAMLVVSGAPGEFEAGMSTNGETKAHLVQAASFGIKEIIVGVNKMDATEPAYSEARFTQISKDLESYLKTIGYDPTAVAMVPVTGVKEDNMTEPSSNMPWYSGWNVTRTEGNVAGKTLSEALDATSPPSHLREKPLRLPIQDVYKVGGVGTVPVGRVESGTIKPDMVVTISPANITTRVKKVDLHNVPVDEGGPGDTVNVALENVSVKDIRKGHVIGEGKNDPPRETETFTAQVIVLNQVSQITVGYIPYVQCHAAYIPCEFTEIKKKLDLKTGVKIEDSPQSLKIGDVAVVKLTPKKSMCTELFSEYPTLGRFTILEMNQMVAVGIITEVTKRDSSGGKVTKSAMLAMGN